MDLYYKVMAISSIANKEDKDYSCTIGVGDGTGNLFVHGDYDSIKHLQGELLELSKFKTAARELSEVLEEYNKFK